jgi:hypothetical protein
MGKIKKVVVESETMGGSVHIATGNKITKIYFEATREELEKLLRSLKWAAGVFIERYDDDVVEGYVKHVSVSNLEANEFREVEEILESSDRNRK